jgi:hypothetical protein
MGGLLVTQPVGFRSDALTLLLRTIRADETSLPVISTSPFQDSGRITIEGERIRYTSKTPTSFEGCTRGADLQEGGTGPMPHPGGALVSQDTPALKGIVHNEILVPQRSALALYEGAGIDLTLVDNPTLERSEVTISNLNNALSDLDDVVIANVAEGHQPVHDGTQWVNRPTGTLLKARVTELIEDFDGGTLTSGQVGRGGWGVNLSGTGALSNGATPSGHPALLQLSTGGTSGSVSMVYQAAGNIFINDVDEAEWIFNTLGSVASVQHGVFLTDALAIGTNVVGVLGDVTGVGAGWRPYKAVAAVSTIGADSGVSIVANTWYRVLLKRTGSGAFDVTIEGNGQIATVAISGLTTTAQYFPAFRVLNNAAAVKEMYADYFRRVTAPLTRF